MVFVIFWCLSRAIMADHKFVRHSGARPQSSRFLHWAGPLFKASLFFQNRPVKVISTISRLRHKLYQDTDGLMSSPARTQGAYTSRLRGKRGWRGLKHATLVTTRVGNCRTLCPTRTVIWSKENFGWMKRKIFAYFLCTASMNGFRDGTGF